MVLSRMLIGCSCIICLCLSSSEKAPPTNGIAAITSPSADITLGFLQPGKVDSILVKEGDKVDVNSLLIKQYDVAEVAYFEQTKVDLKRLEVAQKRNAATDLEVEHAKLEVKIAETRVDNMKLKSPIAGFVEKIDTEVGESVQALKDVIRVVKTNPLWIDVHVPQNEAYNIKLGDIADVLFPEPVKAVLKGKVTFVAQAADAASDTRRVRIELSNNTGRPSGEHVKVSFNGGQNNNEPDKNEK